MKTIFNETVNGKNITVEQGDSGMFLTVDSKEYSQSFDSVADISGKLWGNHGIDIRGEICGRILEASKPVKSAAPVNVEVEARISGDINKFNTI